MCKGFLLLMGLSWVPGGVVGQEQPVVELLIEDLGVLSMRITGPSLAPIARALRLSEISQAVLVVDRDRPAGDVMTLGSQLPVSVIDVRTAVPEDYQGSVIRVEGGSGFTVDMRDIPAANVSSVVRSLQIGEVFVQVSPRAETRAVWELQSLLMRTEVDRITFR